MNYNSSQSEATSVEMQNLMSTEAQFITADSKPLLTIKQDAMSGGYIFTLGIVQVSKHTFMDACCVVDDWSIDAIIDKMDQIRQVHKWLGIYDIEVSRLEDTLPQCRQMLADNREQLKTLKIDHSLARGDMTRATRIKENFNQMRRHIQKLKRRIEHLEDPALIAQEASDTLLYTGHGLISMLFPNDFNFNHIDPKIAQGQPLKIIRGVLISGTIAKPSLMSIIHHIYKDYGASFGCDFITYYQRFMNLLMARRGFSVGLEDCTPFNTELIEQEKERCFLQAKTVMETEPDLELRESKILGILNQATDIGEKIVRSGIDPNNNFMHMIISGAKGSIFNYVNAVNAVGQQNLGGKRAPKDCGGRTLPCYQPTPGDHYSPDILPVNNKLTDYENMLRVARSRAFIDSSYYTGLTSTEFFFLAAGGRDGLIDTSVKTAKCGYTTRRLLKLMEDIKISYNGSVVNSKGTIVQFCYGDDNLAAPDLIPTKFGYQCSDISHIADVLNSEYEWEQYEATLPKKEPKTLIPLEPVDEWDGIGY